MIAVYWAKSDETAPVPVQCEKPGWPNRDVDGNTMYDNTHFSTEAEAWDQLIREHRAGVGLTSMRVRQVRAELARVEAELVEQTLLLTETEDNHRRWTHQQEQAATEANASP